MVLYYFVAVINQIYMSAAEILDFLGRFELSCPDPQTMVLT